MEGERNLNIGIEGDKQRIIKLWQEVGVKRDLGGVSDLINFLETSDFFTAPCSTQFHLAVPGGLAQHSLNVYDLLEDKVWRYVNVNVAHDSIVICGLGHDLCKINFYVEDKEPCSPAQLKYLNDLAIKHGCPVYPPATTSKQARVLIDFFKDNSDFGNPPALPIAYKVSDQFPMGHGEKSVSMLQDFIHLTMEEKLAIRFHMGPYEQGVMLRPLSYAFDEAKKVSPLVTLLQTADIEASSIIEAEG